MTLEELNIKLIEDGKNKVLDLTNLNKKYALFSLPVKACDIQGDTLWCDPLYLGDGNRAMPLKKDNIVCKYYFGMEFYVYAVLKTDKYYKALLELESYGIITATCGFVTTHYEED